MSSSGRLITSADIADLSIVNADVAAAAAIVASKLAAGGTANRVVATVDGAAVAMQQIATAMIAAGAITQVASAAPTSAGPTKGDGTPAVIPQMSVTLTTLAGSVVLVMAEASISNTSVGATTVTDIWLDGGVFTRRETICKVANAYESVVHLVGFSPSAASHTFELRWWVTGGTAQNAGNARSLTVVELKK